MGKILPIQLFAEIEAALETIPSPKFNVSWSGSWEANKIDPPVCICGGGEGGFTNNRKFTAQASIGKSGNHFSNSTGSNQIASLDIFYLFLFAIIDNSTLTPLVLFWPLPIQM